MDIAEIVMGERSMTEPRGWCADACASSRQMGYAGYLERIRQEEMKPSCRYATDQKHSLE